MQVVGSQIQFTSPLMRRRELPRHIWCFSRLRTDETSRIGRFAPLYVVLFLIPDHRRPGLRVRMNHLFLRRHWFARRILHAERVDV